MTQSSNKTEYCIQDPLDSRVKWCQKNSSWRTSANDSFSSTDSALGYIKLSEARSPQVVICQHCIAAIINTFVKNLEE